MSKQASPKRKTVILGQGLILKTLTESGESAMQVWSVEEIIPGGFILKQRGKEKRLKVEFLPEGLNLA